MINSLQPDFLWVGLGAPKQEKWIAAHLSRINVRVQVGGFTKMQSAITLKNIGVLLSRKHPTAYRFLHRVVLFGLISWC
jgi:hypothetical protein